MRLYTWRLYTRWGGIVVVGVVIALLAARRYDRDVAACSVATLLAHPRAGEVRVSGQVVAGSVMRQAGGTRLHLSSAAATLSAHYVGEDADDIRDLKNLVLVGRWDVATRTFAVRKIAPTPNYGFVTAAYLMGLIPAALFLFGMERTVLGLYAAIKDEKVYTPERG